MDRKSSYPHYTTVFNLADIEFPITSKDIPKFKNLNNISINVYSIEDKQIVLLRLTDVKKDKHVNHLYLDFCNDNIRHFAWIKSLFCLVRLQITGKENRTENIFAVSIIRKVDKKTIFKNRLR